MKTRVLLTVAGLLFAALPASAGLVGQWDFNDADNPLAATIGNDLELLSGNGSAITAGTDTAVAGVDATDGARQIGVGNFYKCTHGIAANGGGNYVNEYTLLFDVSYPTSSDGTWMCLFQTNQTNTNDGECFFRGGSGTVGISSTGYSANSTDPDTWYRVVVSVNNDDFYRIYVDGSLWKEGAKQKNDGTFSLDPTMLFFADNNGEDNPINVTTLAIWDGALTGQEVAAMGDVTTTIPEPTTVALLALGSFGLIRRKRA